jgi:7,8-dihydroneopterin aldolase/epimerase/oxygenase
MDCIEIRRLAFFAHHGVLDAESQLGQRFIVSVRAFTPLHGVGSTDNYTQTVCYHKAALLCQSIGKNSRYKTIEALAHHMALALLQEFITIHRIEICIEKPAAAIDAQFDTVAVTINRTREDLAA